jgi:hypothetical protein
MTVDATRGNPSGIRNGPSRSPVHDLSRGGTRLHSLHACRPTAAAVGRPFAWSPAASTVATYGVGGCCRRGAPAIARWEMAALGTVARSVMHCQLLDRSVGDVGG